MQDSDSLAPSEVPEDPFARMKLITGWEQVKIVPPLEGQKILRDWWHDVLRNYGQYPCYAIFLGLPADTKLKEYLQSFSKELEIISRGNCLIMVISEMGFCRDSFNEPVIHLAINESINNGQNVPLAKLFGIGFDQFPCLVMFTDVRSTQHVIVSLKDLEAENIANVVRSIFSIIEKAVSQNENPLAEIEKRRAKEVFVNKGKNVVSEIQNFIGKTVDVVVEAWIKTIIK